MSKSIYDIRHRSFFFFAKQEKGMHEEESSTSQLGWHHEDPSILYRQTRKILLINI